MRNILLVLAMVFSFPALAFDIPISEGKVTDNAHILTSGEKAALVARLNDIEKRDDHPQIGILTVASLPDEGIEEFANQVFHKWGIGQKGVDNGMLLVVAPNQRKMRLEVGYGFESVIPDSVAARIIDSMKPNLKSKQWAAALNTAVDGIVKSLPIKLSPTIEGKPVPAATLKPASKPVPTSHWLVLSIMVSLVGAIVTLYWYRERERERERVRRFNESLNRVKSYTEKLDSEKRWNNTFYQKPVNKPPSSFNKGVVAGVIADEIARRLVEKQREEDETYTTRSSSSSSSSSSDSSWGSSSSSDSGSSWGGGDSGGGGSSGDW